MGAASGLALLGRSGGDGQGGLGIIFLIAFAVILSGSRGYIGSSFLADGALNTCIYKSIMLTGSTLLLRRSSAQAQSESGGSNADDQSDNQQHCQ